MKTKTFTLQLFAPCIVIFALTCSLQLTGQSLVEFNASALVSSPVPTELPVANIVPNLTSTSITRNNVSAVGTNGAFTSSNWPVSPAAAPAGDKYLTFTLAAAEGYVLDLTGATIQFACRRSGSGTNAVHLYTSVDGFSSSANSLITVTPIVSSGGTPFSYTFPNGGAYDNLFSIEIRIYADQASSTGGLLRLLNPTTGGNIRITGGLVKPYGNATIPCGATYYNFLSNIPATPIAGALAYRFTFYDNSTLSVIAQRTQASRILSLSTISGLYYNTTYRLTVAVDIGYGFGPASSIACTAIMGIPQPVVPCGVTHNNLNSFANASNVLGIVGYRFTFYNNVSLEQVAQVTQPSRTIVFGTVPGLYNDNTYRYTVAVEYQIAGNGTAFGPESSNSCTVTFGPAKTTLPCGNTYGNLASNVTVPAAYGAVNYRFRFYNNSTLAQVAEYTQASNTLMLSNVAGLFYGNTYRWTVAVEFFNGSANVFGPESSISCPVTVAAPQTVVPCGGVYNIAGFANAIASPGAVGYRFRFYDESVLVAQHTQARAKLYFLDVPGLTAGAYTWTVEVQYNNGTGLVFGAASAPCAITLTAPARLAGEQPEADQNSAERDDVTSGDNIETITQIKVYPNPATDKINIVTDEPVLACQIYSITGELVKSYDPANEIVISDLAPGMYFILVQTESGMKRANFVKE